MKKFIFGALAVWLVFSSAKNAAFAQGATGGVVGKQNKDAAGGIDVPEPRRAGPKRAPSEPAGGSASLTAASLRGHWDIAVTCSDGSADWTFDIRDESPSSFSGDNGPGAGKIIKGTISGNEIFLVTQYTWTRTWTGRVSGARGSLRMEGRITGYGINTFADGNCRFKATKG